MNYEEENDEEEEFADKKFIVKVARTIAGENFFVVGAENSVEAIGKIIDLLRKDKSVTSIAGITASELIGGGEILFLTSKL